MNKVMIEPIIRKVDVQPFYNKVDVELIRIHTDFEFLWYSQTTPEHKEV
jgi:hypothetical protein